MPSVHPYAPAAGPLNAIRALVLSATAPEEVAADTFGFGWRVRERAGLRGGGGGRG